MGKLIYSANCSLDGYINDADGNFDWSVPDEELHQAINDMMRPMTTMLLGRRMYETLTVWETWDVSDEPPVIADFQRIWFAMDKIIYSTTLTDVATSRTTIARTFDPAAVSALVSSSAGDVGIGGPTLAAHAIRAGLVDEFHAWVAPVIVGGGTHWLPEGLRVDLRMREARKFEIGFAHWAFESLSVRLPLMMARNGGQKN